MKTNTLIDTFAEDIVSYYWSLLGISIPDQQLVQEAISRLSIYSMGIDSLESGFDSIEQGILYYMGFLELMETKYGLRDHYFQLVGESEKTLESGLDLVLEKLAVPGSIVGLCGMPACGKTTIMNHFLSRGIICIDEFWHNGSDYESGDNQYMQKLEEAYKMTQDGASVLVAGALLDPNIIDFSVVVEANKETRLLNLKKRSHNPRDRDGIRINAFPIYEVVDFFRYGLQRIGANLIIDNSERRY